MSGIARIAPLPLPFTCSCPSRARTVYLSTTNNLPKLQRIERIARPVSVCVIVASGIVSLFAVTTTQWDAAMGGAMGYLLFGLGHTLFATMLLVIDVGVVVLGVLLWRLLRSLPMRHRRTSRVRLYASFCGSFCVVSVDLRAILYVLPVCTVACLSFVVGIPLTVISL